MIYHNGDPIYGRKTVIKTQTATHLTRKAPFCFCFFVVILLIGDHRIVKYARQYSCI